MREAPRPLLIYDQIDANRRRALELIGVFSLICVPTVGYAAAVLVGLFVLAISIRLGPGSALRLAPAIPITGVDFAAATIGIAILLLLLIVVAAYFMSADLILASVGARQLDDREEPELHRIVENLCIGAGLPRPRLYVLEEVGPNAFALGNDPAAAVIVVTRGLLELADRDELMGVIAHELSHIGNRDTAVTSLLIVLTGLVHFPRSAVISLVKGEGASESVIQAGSFVYAGFLLFWPLVGVPTSKMIEAIGRDASRAGTQLATALPFVIPIASLLYVVLIAPLLADLARAALSREHETRADADAALLTRNPQGLAEALAKISGATRARSLTATPVSQLCIVDPLGGGFSTHPPIEQRIAALAAMTGGSIMPADLEQAQDEGAVWASEVPASAIVAKGAFRLETACTLYDTPTYAGRQIDELAVDDVVVLVERYDDFFRVISPKDTFGYIRVTTPMRMAADLPGTPLSAKLWQEPAGPA
jgi:heat shock protein HtpX